MLLNNWTGITRRHRFKVSSNYFTGFNLRNESGVPFSEPPLISSPPPLVDVMGNPYGVYRSSITYRISYSIFYRSFLKSPEFPVNSIGHCRKNWGGGANYERGLLKM